MAINVKSLMRYKNSQSKIDKNIESKCLEKIIPNKNKIFLINNKYKYSNN
jgi:hypothetical protein